MARWDSQFMIGNGERTDESAVKPVYRSYENECGIVLDRDSWREQAKLWSIYYPSTALSPIEFEPKEQVEQPTSMWRFLRLDVKIPRPR